MKLNGKMLSAHYTGKSPLPPGRYSDGRCLYLRVTSPKAASWMYFAQIDGKRREIGLGSYMGTGRAVRLDLPQARMAADKLRARIARGEKNIAARDKRQSKATFGQMLDSYLAKEAVSWKGDDNEKAWRRLFAKHAAELCATKVDRVDLAKVLEAIKPIWNRSIGDTLRTHIETVLDHARVLGHRRGDNPARWTGHLEHLLPAKTEKGKTNFATLSDQATVEFYGKLGEQQTAIARVLQFIILTAVRANEAAGAWWSEFDLDNAVWEIPAARMKGGKAHIVPLSRQAVELLRALPRNGEYVFPALTDATKPMASSMMNELIWRMGYKGKATIHGFRSTFRDWAGDETGFDREAIEFCLAHKIGDKVEAAYRRGSAVAKRRQIMQAWADMVCAVSNIVMLPVKERA